MFRIVAEKIVLFMLQHKWLNQSKREIYEYAMEVLLLNGGILIIELIVSIISNQMPFFIAFLFAFVPIRKYLGGLHLKSSGLCMIFSVTVYVLAMFANHYIFSQYGIYELMLVIFLTLICLILKPLPAKIEERGRHNKLIANGIILIELLLILMSWKMDIRLVSAFILLDISALLFFLLAKFRIWLGIEQKQE